MVKQQTKSSIGIWMDHFSAHIIPFDTGQNSSFVISQKSDFHETDYDSGLNESMIHHKEQGLQKDYYNKIIDVIQNYNNIILFGPTDAKTELFNIIKKDYHFDKKQIDIQQTDKMTIPQQLAFVKSYFMNQSFT